MPDAGPFGETRFEAKDVAMAEALRLNNPSGGWVESVFTLATHRFELAFLLLLAFFALLTSTSLQAIQESCSFARGRFNVDRLRFSMSRLMDFLCH